MIKKRYYQNKLRISQDKNVFKRFWLVSDFLKKKC